jgi:hypothetical protein
MIIARICGLNYKSVPWGSGCLSMNTPMKIGIKKDWIDFILYDWDLSPSFTLSSLNATSMSNSKSKLRFILENKKCLMRAKGMAKNPDKKSIISRQSK